MNNLEEKYGSILFHKGSKFYHTSHEGLDFNGKYNKIYCLLFDKWNIWSSDNNHQYCLTLKKDIKCLFMLKSLSRRYLWSGEDIYNEHYKIKHKELCSNPNMKLDKIKCRKLVTIIKDNNFDGWYTSVEDKTSCEVCIFLTENIKDLFIVEDHKIEIPIQFSKIPTLKIGTCVKYDHNYIIDKYHQISNQNSIYNHDILLIYHLNFCKYKSK